MPYHCKHFLGKELRCNEVDEVTKDHIHSEFWDGDYEARTSWLSHMVEVSQPKRRKKEGRMIINREFSRQYYLYSGTRERVRVCQGLLLSALGYSSDEVIKVMVNKT